MQKLGLAPKAPAEQNGEQPPSEHTGDSAAVAAGQRITEQIAQAEQRQKAQIVKEHDEEQKLQKAILMQQNAMLQQQRNITNLQEKIEQIQVMLYQQNAQIEQAKRNNVHEVQIQGMMQTYHKTLQQSQMSKFYGK